MVFYCSHSYEPGHPPFEIKVAKDWVVKSLAWLPMCLKIITGVATAKGKPIPAFKLLEYEMIGNFLDGMRNSDTVD